MPLSVDDFVHQNQGYVVANTSIVVSLAGADTTTANNTVLVFLIPWASITVVPTGFALSGVADVRVYKKIVAAGESSWTWTQATAQDAAWIVVEMSGLDTADEPYETGIQNTGATLSTGQTHSTGTTTINSGLDTVEFAVWYTSTGLVAKSFAGYTNGFEELAQIPSDATNRLCLAVARKFTTGAPATFESTATVTIASGTSFTRGRMLVYRAAGSLISAPLGGLTGFEFGTHGGLAENTVHATGSNQPLGGGVNPPVGTWGTHYQIGSSYGRNSSYGMHIATSAAICYVPSPYGQANGVYAQSLRVVSGSGTPTIMTWDVATGTDLLLVYEVSSTRFGLRWGAGTVSWQTGTTALNTWAWVEVRIKINGTGLTVHHAEWSIDSGGGVQTSPADLTGQVSTVLSMVALSGTGSQTLTLDADDMVMSNMYAAWPLGEHKVVALTVDTGGTATVSGTAANFNVFTANGTLAAFSSAAALAALDEVPPTVSASADGLVQVTLAATDYVELPMTTYTLASDEVIAGVRMIASMWGGTGSATGTFGIKGYDGVTETSLAPNTKVYDAASPVAYSATEPLWMASNWALVSGNPWTPTRLANAVLRVGYSSDATPDMGISAIYLEVAIKTLPTVRTLTIEDPISATVDLIVNPYNSATVSYIITNNDATLTAQFDYSILGTPQTPVTVGPSSNTTVDIHAAAFGDVDSIALTAS